MSNNNFRYQLFVAVSGNLGGKVPIVDDVLSSHEQEIYPTTSLHENCKEFEFQTDRNYYVDLRQSFLAWKLKFVEGRCYVTYKSKENKKEHKDESVVFTETGNDEEEQEVVARVTYVNNIMLSKITNVEVYINNQQIYNSNRFYAHKTYISNNFKAAISEYKGVLHLWRYDYEQDPEDFSNPLSDPFFTKRMKLLSRPDGFMLYGKLGIDFFSTSELLYPNTKIRLRLIRARPNFYMIRHNPNVSLGNRHWRRRTEVVARVTYVNDIMLSKITNVEVYINNQQIYNSNRFYAHKTYISNNFKAAISEYKGVLHLWRYDYEQDPEDFSNPLSDPFFTKRMKLLSRPDGFMLYGKLGIDFFSTSELLYPNTKIRLRLIRARPNFYMIRHNPNVSLGIVDCSLYTRRIAPKDNYHKKRMDMPAYAPVEYNFLETLANTFIIPARQNQFIQENIFNNAPIRRIAISMNTNSAFTGSFTENPFWYQEFDLRQIRKLRRGEPIVDFDTADTCRLYVTTMKAMNFQDDIPSIPTEDYKDHYVLVFELTSMQDATENCHYPERVGEPLRLELKFTNPLENVLELIV